MKAILKITLVSFVVCAALGCVADESRMVALEVSPPVSLTALEEGRQFQAVAIDEDGGRRVLDGAVWTSQDPGLASLSGRGLATGVGLGEAQIHAEFEGFEAVASLGVVSHRLTALGLTPETPTVEVGESVHLTVTGTFADGSSAYVTPYVLWESADSAVANIAGGRATGLSPGRTTMVARVGGVEGRIGVEVVQVPSTETLSSSQ